MYLGCHGHGMALFSSHREEQMREGAEPGRATLASLGAQGKTQVGSFRSGGSRFPGISGYGPCQGWHKDQADKVIFCLRGKFVLCSEPVLAPISQQR